MGPGLRRGGDFESTRKAEQLEQDAIRVIGLFLSVMGGRVEVPDKVVEALPYDAQVVRWRNESKRVEVWELQLPRTVPPAPGEQTPIHDQLAAEKVLEETRQVLDEAGPDEPA